MFLTIQLLPYVSDFVLTEMKRMVTGIASGMRKVKLFIEEEDLYGGKEICTSEI